MFPKSTEPKYTPRQFVAYLAGIAVAVLVSTTILATIVPDIRYTPAQAAVVASDESYDAIVQARLNRRAGSATAVTLAE